MELRFPLGKSSMTIVKFTCLILVTGTNNVLEGDVILQRSKRCKYILVRLKETDSFCYEYSSSME